MIDFFTSDWESTTIPGGWRRNAYLGCAHIWPVSAPDGQWHWRTEYGYRLECLASGYTDDLDEAKSIVDAVFPALAAVRPNDGPQAHHMKSIERNE